MYRIWLRARRKATALAGAQHISLQFGCKQMLAASVTLRNSTAAAMAPGGVGVAEDRSQGEREDKK